MTPADDPKPVEPVQSLKRGLAVIRAFDADRPRMTLAEVARRTDLSRAAARRFLHTLVAAGYTATDGHDFWLTPRVLELGYAYLSSISLPEIAMPHLEELTRQVHESSSVSVLDGTDVVYVARVPTRRIMTVAINVGTRFPAYATSMGRVLLAELDGDALAHALPVGSMEALTPRTITSVAALREELVRVREQGWAFVDQELEPGLRAMAAPLRDRSGEVVAAVNVSIAAADGAPDEVRDRLLPPLIATAEGIQRDLASAGSAGRR